MTSFHFLFIFFYIPVNDIWNNSIQNKIEEKLRKDRWHKHSVWEDGGVAIWFSFLITSIIFIDINVYQIILIFSTMSFLIGLYDDIFDLKPQLKMIYVVALSLGCFYLDIKFMPSLPVYFNLPLTILWFAGVINAVNLIDNLDGYIWNSLNCFDYDILIFVFLW